MNKFDFFYEIGETIMLNDDDVLDVTYDGDIMLIHGKDITIKLALLP